MLREAIAKKIESIDVRRQLGMSLLYSGRVQEGIATFEALTRDVPDVVAQQPGARLPPARAGRRRLHRA